jgi:hypothetical protein
MITQRRHGGATGAEFDGVFWSTLEMGHRSLRNWERSDVIELAAIEPATTIIKSGGGNRANRTCCACGGVIRF